KEFLDLFSHGIGLLPLDHDLAQSPSEDRPGKLLLDPLCGGPVGPEFYLELHRLDGPTLTSPGQGQRPLQQRCTHTTCTSIFLTKPSPASCSSRTDTPSQPSAP